MYEGSWVNNTIEGRGLAIYPSGQRYEGMFSNGRREGRGTVYFTNGAVYEGRFRDDAIDGQGTMKMSRSMIIAKEEEEDEEDDGALEEQTNAQGTAGIDTNKDTGTVHQQQKGTKPKVKPDFMIPISFQSDITHIHTKAGFTAIGD
jgi:hypothetical protein